MATLGSAFNIAAGALDADQAALNVLANNTANVNTPGYTLEAPVWSEADTVSLNGASYGMGVQMSGPRSQRSLVLEKAVQQQTQETGASGARFSALQQIQALFSGATSAGTDASQSSGIGSDLSGLFNALSSMEANPADVSLRQQVLSAAGALASDFNGAAAQLQSQAQSLDQQAGSVMGQANSLLTDIAHLNLEIETTSPKGDAGVLEDQRQQDLTNLSQLVGIRTIPTESNGLTVTTTGGALLVAEGQAFPMSGAPSGGTTAFYDAQGNDITAQLAAGGGQLGGILTARDQDIPQVLSSLDTLAYTVASELNTQNEAGVDVNGNPGTAIFSLPSTVTSTNTTGAAAGIAVAMTDPSQIAAAAAGKGSSDSANVTAMANLANQASVDGSTPTAYFSDFVTTLGSMVSEVTTENTAQQAALSQLQGQVGSLSGVNLNDEAAQLETLEQSYQAASKLFTILDQAMTAALNLGVQTTYS
jgi:flagellar hook-associated protein 1 FlgK